MLQLQSIALTQFRNYVQQQFSFTEKVVGICGKNGTGKTNLLDAIYYLGFTKSYFATAEAQNVHHNFKGMRIEGMFLRGDTAQKVCSILRENNTKEIFVNDMPYQKFSEHIGKFSCVMIAPDDVEIIVGGSEGRRKMIDTILSQLNANYLQSLILYNKVLQQRNTLFKQATEAGALNQDLLAVYNLQLVQQGNFIFQQRTKFLQTFIPFVTNYYARISGTNDTIFLTYESDLQKKKLEKILQDNFSKDLILQRTTGGVHKDDLQIKMEVYPFKTTASQGQRKSLLFALKLAEWQMLGDDKKMSPLLLLDDVFEKLDDHRMNNLLHIVGNTNSAQIFITDTHKERLQTQLQSLGVPHQLIELGEHNSTI